MKKTLLLCTLTVIAVAYSYAQNTFPSSGNVGIGTTSPGLDISFIDVNQGSAVHGITWFSPAATDYAIHRTAGTWTGPNYQQLRLGWQTGIVLDPGTLYGKSYVDITGNGLRVTSGNVGIGTTNPPFKLSVADSNASVQLRLQRTGTYTGLTDIGSDSVGFKIFSGGYDGVPEFILSSNGNVGIGTIDTKGYRLAVNGSTIFTSVKVKQYAAWPDYVFDAAYILPSLTDVEAHIKCEGHLPDVPSAKEIKENGLDVGESQAVLLRKIEELTLYAIQQQKEIDELRKAIKK